MKPYHLVKKTIRDRETRRWKKVYYIAILGKTNDDGRKCYSSMESLDTGEIKEAAIKAAARWKEIGGSCDDSLHDYLINFWDRDQSKYLSEKSMANKIYSSTYLHDNKHRIETHFLPWCEKNKIISLSQLTRPVLLDWQIEMFKSKVISPENLNKLRQCISKALSYAVTMGKIPYNHLKSIEPVDEPKPEKKVFEENELFLLLREPWPDPRAYAGSLLAFTTGCRMGEVRGMKIENVHLNEDGKNCIDIKLNYVAIDGLKAPKTKKGIRKDQFIPDITVRAIQAVLDIHPYGAKPDQYLFFSTGSSEYPCDRKIFEKGLFSQMKKNNIKKDGRSFHSLRHNYMTVMAGILPPSKLRRLGVHTNDAMDDDYIHIMDEDRVIIRKKFTGLLTEK